MSSGVDAACRLSAVLFRGHGSDRDGKRRDLKGIIHETKPDLIIAIDALAARSVKRLGTTIQLTDTGSTGFRRR